MTNPEHDEVFEAYLKRRSVLPNALDDRLEPPAALDEIVLQRAGEAIKAQAAPDATQQTVRAPRWAMPVALAATILLCLSVVLNISLNTNRPTPNLQHMTAARTNVSPDAEAGARGDGRTNNDGERRESVSGDVPSHEVILTEAKVAGSPAPRAPVVADSAVASPPPAPTARADGGGPAGPSAFASAAAPAPPARSPADKAERFLKRAIAPSPGSASSSAPSAAGAANAPTSGAATPHPADPKAWLQQIGALRAAGETDRADAEMRRFRVVFPGYAPNPAPPAASEPPK
jgi:hypothetical protein